MFLIHRNDFHLPPGVMGPKLHARPSPRLSRHIMKKWCCIQSDLQEAVGYYLVVTWVFSYLVPQILDRKPQTLDCKSPSWLLKIRSSSLWVSSLPFDVFPRRSARQPFSSADVCLGKVTCHSEAEGSVCSTLSEVHLQPDAMNKNLKHEELIKKILNPGIPNQLTLNSIQQRSRSMSCDPKIPKSQSNRLLPYKGKSNLNPKSTPRFHYPSFCSASA